MFAELTANPFDNSGGRFGCKSEKCRFDPIVHLVTIALSRKTVSERRSAPGGKLGLDRFSQNGVFLALGEVFTLDPSLLNG